MATFYSEINQRNQQFIEAQKMFFVATATANGRINLSPKGMDSFRIVNKTKVLWLNLTGSGNETAAHVIENPRMTLMFCAFEGAPKILRLYGNATTIHPRDAAWKEAYGLFPEIAGARQIFEVNIKSVQTSCGMAIPFFDYKEERTQLLDFAKNKGDEGLKTYWKEKNQTSIDGLPTKIIDL